MKYTRVKGSILQPQYCNLIPWFVKAIDVRALIQNGIDI